MLIILESFCITLSQNEGSSFRVQSKQKKMNIQKIYTKKCNLEF